ncbi:MBL fold metallo-hydrolase [Candidatus Thorarchaeota archaeon]|nr:MAG: MBL fold metallo-hydrolase [Candidatus Thorarchaeota archaeon]
MRTRLAALLVGLLVVGLGATAMAGFLIMGGQQVDTSITLTHLDHAGVMIEARGLRIYIDPINLEDNYTQLPADVVLITHHHGDHYQESNVSLLQKEGTINVFPAIMSEAIATHDGVSVVPGDTMTMGSIMISAFYMYTTAPEGFDSTHPRESNYTSYLVDINGFTIFHAGDSRNITEYEQLSGSVDVALLPIGPGCQTMYGYEVVDAIEKMQPGYFIPIHTTELNAELFLYTYGDDIEEISDCQCLVMPDFSSHVFEP